MTSGVSDELQRQADTRRVLNGETDARSKIADHDPSGTARSAAVATERTDDVATAFLS